MATLYGFATEVTAAVLPFANWHDDGDGPGWLFGFVFWLAIIAVIVLLIRGRGWFGPMRGMGRGGESGLQLIERRFAEGKLSAEEFRQRRSVLGEGEAKRGEGDAKSEE